MKLYGLIGYPLEHSFSKKYFNEKFKNEGLSDVRYELFPLKSIETLPELINSNKYLAGLNVTIPYKKSVLKFLDKTEGAAREIGAVNCIKIIRENNKNTLIGYNTDVYGFEKSLTPLLKEHHSNALILGTGGASNAVEYVLKKLDIQYIFVSRTPKNSQTIGYKDINKEVLKNHTIIINTSPLGMYPDVDTAPALSYNLLSEKHLLYDLVYNPVLTKFMLLGKKYGADVNNGLDMLYGQAEKAWEIWNQ